MRVGRLRSGLAGPGGWAPGNAFKCATRRHLSLASHPASKVQLYLSQSNDPYLNLSIEHHLLQKTPPDSTVLFLYTNRPCIVIGRNQNPWLEVNLPLIESLRGESHQNLPKQGSRVAGDLADLQLVRRRSGGGTVFHDLGNVNYSVICPTAVFDRDRHAEMVVRALGRLGIGGRAKVNARHDIVMEGESSDSDAAIKTFKVSGSAYKLTRQRSLHHGTCLLSSPNLGRVSSLLRSPAEPFIRARGVESVRSPIANVGLAEHAGFEEAVRREFEALYGVSDVYAQVGTEATELDDIRRGMIELKTRRWIYGQTPKFAFSTHPTDEDPRERPWLPHDLRVEFEAKQGDIVQFSAGKQDSQSFNEVTGLNGTPLYDIPAWDELLQESHLSRGDGETLGRWLESLFGAGRKKDSQ